MNRNGYSQLFLRYQARAVLFFIGATRHILSFAFHTCLCLPSSPMEVLQLHEQTIDAMGIPDVVTFDATYVPSVSPRLNQFKLEQIKHELTLLSKRHPSPQLTSFLCLVVEEKIYVNSKLIEQFDKQHEKEVEEQEPIELHTPETAEDLGLLRKRLLSGGTLILDAESNKQSDYQESIQNSIMEELLDMTKVLKDSSLKFASSLANDTKMLEQTSDNMLKNSDLFNTLNKNLTGYVENKTGYKIGLFFLIKATAALIVGFLIMIFLVKLLPAL